MKAKITVTFVTELDPKEFMLVENDEPFEGADLLKAAQAYYELASGELCDALQWSDDDGDGYAVTVEAAPDDVTG